MATSTSLSHPVQTASGGSGGAERAVRRQRREMEQLLVSVESLQRLLLGAAVLAGGAVVVALGALFLV